MRYFNSWLQIASQPKTLRRAPKTKEMKDIYSDSLLKRTENQKESYMKKEG
jgi:hypothetical protein